MPTPRRTPPGCNCPECGSGTEVVDSRPADIGIRRRRRCPKCQVRFTTYEVVALEPSIAEERTEQAKLPSAIHMLKRMEANISELLDEVQKSNG